MERPIQHFIFAATVAASAFGLTACSPEQVDDDGCLGKCDGFGGDVGEALASRSDPVAKFLRQSGIDDEGFIDTSFGAMLFALSEVQGCSPEDVKTFVVSDDLIQGTGAFPRLVSAACTGDAEKGSEFFMALSFEDGDEPGEMDLDAIEAFAWDAQARKYNFYESQAAEQGGLRMNVSPTVCEQCHLTSSDMAPDAMHMTPVMNELTRPWTHWNASPGFPSFEFEVPERATESDSWNDWVEPWKGQADHLERLIRAGQTKVALARVRERRDSVDIPKAMGLLRPVFCSEQVNYASEDFNSGSLIGSSVLDPGLRQAFLQIRPDNWEWAWLNDVNMRLPSASGDVVDQLPVRGNADVTVENLLISTKVLTPQQVLRVRALDYSRPVFSEFRCGLFKEATARFEANPPDLSSATRNSHAIPILFEAIMSLGPVALKPAVEGNIVVVAASEPEISALLFNGLKDGTLTNDCSTGVCELTVDELGAELQAYYNTINGQSSGRAQLFAERDRRICHVNERVKPVDGRFDVDAVQRSCAVDCCAAAGMEDDEVCIGQTAAAAKAFDNSREHYECAVQCASPIRFTNRPSLPTVAGCNNSSVFLPRP